MQQTLSRHQPPNLPVQVGLVLAILALTCAPSRGQAMPDGLAAPKKVVYIDQDFPPAYVEFNKTKERFAKLGRHNVELSFVPSTSPDDPDKTPRWIERTRAIDPALILATNSNEAIVATREFPATPILYLSNADPRTNKLSAQRDAERNVSGVIFYQPIEGKLVEFLARCVPTVRSVGLLTRTGAAAASTVRAFLQAGAEGGLRIVTVSPALDASWPSIRDAMRSTKVDAWLFPSNFLSTKHRPNLVEYSRAQNLPAMFERKQATDMGGLMSYQHTLLTWHDIWVKQADLIFDGVPPAQIPIERPRTFEFRVNLDAASRIKGFQKQCLREANVLVNVPLGSASNQ
jgi:putative tryptophan/tyrosine transport system substrate-binding protein